MSASLKFWVELDRIMGPVYRAFHFVISRVMRVRHEQTGRVVVIKLFGMGSIIRLLDLCEKKGIDLSGITIVTSHSHKELCELWGLDAIFVNTSSVRRLATGCVQAISAVDRLQPSIIVDFERCSNLVGIFRTAVAWRTRCRTVSFEQRSLTSLNSVVHPVDGNTQEQIFLTGIRHFRASEKRTYTTEVATTMGKVIVNINASDLLEIRRYDLQSFASIVKTIYARNPVVQFFFSGVKREREYVQRLVDMLPGVPANNVAGEWSLRRFIEELSQSQLLITGDSGPLHLASYMNVQTLSIWGPTQPAHFGYSESEGFHPVTLGMECSPCFHHPHSKPAISCKGAITCMSQLNSVDIAARALVLLSNFRESRQIVMPPNVRINAEQPVDTVG